MSKFVIIFDILIAFFVLIVGFILLSTVLHDRLIALSADISDMLPAGINNIIQALLSRVKEVF